MKKIITFAALLAAFTMLAGRASAQVTSSGTLTVSATVTSSISMVLDSDSSGVALTGSGTNAATLAFGSVSAFNTEPTNVTGSYDNTNSQFTVTTPFDVYVTQANGTSSNYTFAAALHTSDSTNTWKIGGTTLTTTSQSISTTDSYGANVSHVLSLTIPYATANSTAISEQIDLMATAN